MIIIYYVWARKVPLHSWLYVPQDTFKMEQGTNLFYSLQACQS